MKRSRTHPIEYRLGAAPFSMNEDLASTQEALRASTIKTTKKNESKPATTGNTSNEANATALQSQIPTVAGFQNYFSCGPSLLQVAAACMTTDEQYPDPDIPRLEEMSTSSTSAEAEAVVRHESSEERRQRLWNMTGNKGDKTSAAADMMMEEQGMELIFFQEDEEDWSQFPWSQRMVQTEKVDKDIFLSFTEMGFDETQRPPPAESNPRLKIVDRLASVPETRTVLSAQEKRQDDSKTGDCSVELARSRTEPWRLDASFDRAKPTQQRTASLQQARVASTTPLVDTISKPSPNRSTVRESIASSDQVVERVVDRSAELVDRVSNIIKSVPNVFAKMAQNASGPSSESQILLTRSSSQVTWVSHDEGFAAMDARPVAEIFIPTTPDTVPKPTVGSSVGGNSVVHAVRNVIFDSIERGSDDAESNRGQSEHKDCEEQDLDGMLGPLQRRPRVNMSSSFEHPLLVSPSSLTSDSRFVPPISGVPVRVPSDGEDQPQDQLQSLSPQVEADWKLPFTTDMHTPGGIGIRDDCTPPRPVTPDFTDYGDDISAIDDDLFLEDSPPPPPNPDFKPQPDTPSERRSLVVPPRSMTLSYSTFDDDESVGLNALASPARQKVAGKLSGDYYRSNYQKPASPPTPPRKTHDKDYNVHDAIDSSNWDYVGRGDMHIPNLTHSDDDSDSSSENIDHLLLHQRPPLPISPSVPSSYEEDEAPSSYDDGSEPSILDHRNVGRTYSGAGFDLESVVETEINEGTGLFSCACWEIPPLLEPRRNNLLEQQQRRRRRREPNKGLLEDRVRSDDDLDRNRRGKGFGRKLVSMARSTSNTFKSIWSPKRHAAV
eukprot:scaffold45543_cov183-Amphora_coffeaeformis.AAC.1